MSSRAAIYIGFLGLVATAGDALAQGYFDFGRIPGVPDEPNVEVDLSGPLLGFVAEAARQSDPAAAEMIRALDGIRVRVYEDVRDASAVNAFVDEASRSLETGGWQRVVFVQDGGDKVRMYARMDGQQMSGMTVLIVDPSDAVFINIAGRIDPAQLGRLAAAMGMDDLLGPFSAAAGAPAEGDAAGASAEGGADGVPRPEPQAEVN